MSTDDEMSIKTPFFSFGIHKKEHQTVIKEGETIIIREWKWKKFGYSKKAITIKDGKIYVKELNQ